MPAYYVPLSVALLVVLVIAYQAGKRTRVNQNGVFNYWYGSFREGARWSDVQGAGVSVARGRAGEIARKDGSTFDLAQPAQSLPLGFSRTRVKKQGSRAVALCHGFAPHIAEVSAETVASLDRRYRGDRPTSWMLGPDTVGWFFYRSGIPLFILAIGFLGVAAAAGVGLADSVPSAHAYRAAVQCPYDSATPPQWCITDGTVSMFYASPGGSKFGVASVTATSSVDVTFYNNVPIINKLLLGSEFTATVSPDGSAASITYQGDTEMTPASPLIEEASYTELTVAMAALTAFLAGVGALFNTGRLQRRGRSSRVIRARLVTLGICGLALYFAAIEQDQIGSSASPVLSIAHSLQIRSYVYPAVCVLIGLLELLRSRRQRASGTMTAAEPAERLAESQP